MKKYLETTLDELSELYDCLLEERKRVSDLKVFDFFADLVEGLHLQADTYQNGLVDVAQIHGFSKNAREVKLRDGWDQVKHEMVIDLIFGVRLESVEITKRDKVLQHFPIHKVAVALIRHYLLFGMMQNLKG